METELETLILAYDKLLAEKDRNAGQAAEHFNALVANLREKHPHLSELKVEAMIRYAHRNWAKAQRKKPSALPPKA